MAKSSPKVQVSVHIRVSMKVEGNTRTKEGRMKKAVAERQLTILRDRLDKEETRYAAVHWEGDSYQFTMSPIGVPAVIKQIKALGYDVELSPSNQPEP